MAINSIEVPCDKTCTISQGSINHFSNDLPESHIADADLSQEESLCNLPPKVGKRKKKVEYKSPYLTGDSVQLLSRVTEKRLIHKKGGQLSTLPLSGNIYKTSLDDFKSLKNNGKKIFKSVLTLPTSSKPVPKLCTVSDVNDTDDDEDCFHKSVKKRNIPSRTRKCRSRGKGYDRDSQYCTDLDTHFDSSQDRLKNYGDNKRSYKSSVGSRGTTKEKVNPHDVWAMLRNMNRFQFLPSPHMSEDSFITKTVNPKRRNNRKDLRVVETRRTEEFAYISSYKMDSPCYSHCSSFDKVTVIDKNQNYKVNSDIETKTSKKKKSRKYVPKSTNKSSSKPKTPLLKHNKNKALTYTNENKVEINDNATEGLPQLTCMDITTSVDLGYESKTTENEEDQIVYENDTRDEMSQYSVVYSDNSGSSKAAFLKQAPHKNGKDRSVMTNTDDRIKQMNGITKVTVGKVRNAETQHNIVDKIETVKKSTRPSGIRTSLTNTPKLTKTEISRQLNKYKFPIMVLGKDQLRSTIHVVNDEHPQFNGLEDKMWPFMKSWYGIEKPTKINKKQFDHTSKAGYNEIERKRLWHSNSPKQKLKDNVIKLDRKHTSSPVSKICNIKTQDPIKTKPMQQITDRMLELLYKNTTLRAGDESYEFGFNKRNNSPTKVNTSTGTDLDFNNCGNSTSTNDNYSEATVTNTRNTTTSVKSYARQHRDSTSFNDNNSAATAATTKLYAKKRSWAKAKWASDFIEKVMKKIGSGAYYNQTNKTPMHRNTGIKDEGIQTDSNSDEEFKMPVKIPGFDDVVPEIEIKSMNMNEVSVKHCVTNIILHFDVIVPTKPMIKTDIPSSLVPVSITKSLTKVFKSQTMLFNAMLPAELCSILPNMFRKIVESGEHLRIFPPPVEQVPCLSTITEVPTRSESAITDILSTPMALFSANILPFIPITPGFGASLSGRYNMEAFKIFPVFRPQTITLESGLSLVEDLRPNLTRRHLFDCSSDPILPLGVTKKILDNTQRISTVSIIQPVNTCTALQLYNPRDHQLSVRPGKQIGKILDSTNTFMSNVGLWFSMSYDYMDFNMKIEKLQKIPDIITLRISNSCTNDYIKSLISLKVLNILPKKSLMQADTHKCPENLQLALACKDDQQLNPPETFHNIFPAVNISKTKRKSFGKLYRKCKSASNIINRGKATPLTRIYDLDDFFQVLGSSKFLSSIFDSQSCFKIMSSIKEMQNWTTEINAKQALLLLLLSNKKDTPNLIRYRPVILQGIAVKRITKVQELNMEIEVIETENLNGISTRYEGITYLPASIENQDSLYEELYWIAKTTASDYQKSFNQTSERLLRSLLEKRKQLNPSYLRVMARYVGLGLLKPQGRKHAKGML